MAVKNHLTFPFLGTLQECCLYVYDDLSDILKYSTFKHNVEEPYYIVDNDENFHMKIGKSTPKHFPSKFLKVSQTEHEINKKKNISFSIHRK